MISIEILKLLLIVIVIGLPPYIVAVKVFTETNRITMILFSIVYWGGTFYTQQIVPFLLILLILIKKYRGEKGQEETLLEEQEQSFRIKDFFIIAIITVLVRFPLGLINMIYILLIDNMGINIQQQEVVDIFVNSQNSLLNILLFFLIVIVAPLNEEFSMRHWLFHKMLSPRTGKIIAAMISSGLFTLLHYNVAGIPTFFLLGLYACYIYNRKGLWGAVTVHFTFNLSSVVLLTISKQLLDVL